MSGMAKYQLYAREIILDGAGLLYERFEALKKELRRDGNVCSRSTNSRFHAMHVRSGL